MNKILLLLIGLVFAAQSIYAEAIVGKVVPVGKTKFKVIDKSNKEKLINLNDKDYIVVSLREKGADGIAYAIDRDGVVWWASPISSGAKGHATPSGIFNVIRKERYYMSKAHPNPKGINNMDFSLWFTNQGHAIHMGNDDAMSYGCIHVGEKGASTMFDWANKETKIVITREHYLPYVAYDLQKAGYTEKSVTKGYIKQYLKEMKPVKPSP